jgi:hypothetical protein
MDVKSLIKELPADKYSRGFYLMDIKDLIYLKQNGSVYE